MAWLSVVAVIGSAALAGIAVKALRWWDDLDSGDSRQWVNHLADQSRKNGRLFADGPIQNDNRRARRYSRAGVMA